MERQIILNKDPAHLCVGLRVALLNNPASKWLHRWGVDYYTYIMQRGIITLIAPGYILIQWDDEATAKFYSYGQVTNWESKIVAHHKTDKDYIQMIIKE